MVQPWFNSNIQKAFEAANFSVHESVLTSQLKALNRQIFPKADLGYARLGISPAVSAELRSGLFGANYVSPLAQFTKMNSVVARYGVSESITEQVFSRMLAGVKSGELDIDENDFDFSEVAPDIEDAIDSIALADESGDATVEEKRKAARLAVTWTLSSLLFVLYIVFPELKNALETAKTSKEHAENIWEFLAKRSDDGDAAE